MADWIPGISQLKSGIQLICGDVEGAQRTQENFLRQCPGISQVTSTVQLIAGDEEGALETQRQCFGALSRVADGVPVVGHAKGLIHYACGDEEGGNRAIRSSTRTCAVMGAGAAGFLDGGPVGAVANMVNNPTAGEFFGMTGQGATVTAVGQISSTGASVLMPESGISLTEHPTRRVYVKRYRRDNGTFEVEITGEDEPSAIVAFIDVENAHISLRNVHSNIAMGKFNDSGRGWLNLLHRHGDDFQQLGLRVDSHDSWNNQTTLLAYLRRVMHISNFIGQEFSHNGSLRFGWRVRDARGRERILIVCYSSQTYEISGNSQISSPFREIMTTYLLEPGENGVFTRPANFIDSGGRSNSR